MSDRPHEDGPSIESLISDAAHYIQPSQDLRPRTIEAAKDRCTELHAEQQLGLVVLAVMLLLLISSPLLQYVDLVRARAKMPTTQEVEELAIEYSGQREIGSHFGMIEAFSELRRLQADRLGNTSRELQ